MHHLHYFKHRATVKGLLSRELIDSIANGVPYSVRDTGLSPVLSIDGMINLTGQLLQTICGRVNIYDGGVLKYIGPQLPAHLATAENVNLLRRDATLAVDALHHDVPVLEDLCIALGSAMGTWIQVNAYLGQNGSSGLGFHPDNHDVLIWQQHGRKIWEVRDEINSQSLIQTTLSPGGALYIPAQHWHGAETLPGLDSLHLTFGFDRMDKEKAEGIWQRIERLNR